MSRKKALIGLSVLLLIFAGMPSVFPAQAEEEPGEEGEVINQVCPVMGGKVDKDTPYRVEYEGKVVGFCCAGCVETFKLEPEKYIEKLQEKRTILCPNCGSVIELPGE